LFCIVLFFSGSKAVAEPFELRVNPKMYFDDYCLALDDRLAHDKKALKGIIKVMFLT
jgi:hypothetical protein